MSEGRFSLKITPGPGGLFCAVKVTGMAADEALTESVPIGRLDDEIENLISELNELRRRAREFTDALKPH